MLTIVIKRRSDSPAAGYDEPAAVLHYFILFLSFFLLSCCRMRGFDREHPGE